MPFLSGNIVDPSPTAADFPRRMWEAGDIPKEYACYLTPYIARGMGYDRILLVPAPKYQPGRKEYMLARSEDRLIYLEKQEDGRIENTVLFKNRIEAVCSVEDLLRGCITVYWTEYGTYHSMDIVFSRSRHDLFEPVLNWMFDCPEDFDGIKAAGKGGRPQRLYSEYPSLYHYSEGLFRLGSARGSWDWWKLEKPRRWYQKKIPAILCLRCVMERGQGLVLIEGTRVDIWYLKEAHGNVVISDGETTTLSIQISQETIKTIN